MPRFALVCLATLLATVTGTAQCPPSEGLFFAAPTALSLANGSGPKGSAVLLKHPGLDGKPPAPGTAYDLEAILRHCGAKERLDVDAVSLGEDWVIADAQGRIQMPNNRWAALTVSVTPGTKGVAGTPLAAEANRNGAHSDVFSWTLPGSAVPPEFLGTARGVDAEEMSFRREDVDALDGFVPLFGLHPGVMQGALTPRRVFFSVSAATLSEVPAAWWGGTKPSGGTIFILVSDTKSGGRWNCPRVWATPADLGLRDDEDVDALAIDVRQCQMLFSTRNPRANRRNPILFLRYCSDAPPAPVPYSTSNGTPVSNEMGLLEQDEDDVDAICAMDPSVRGTSSGVNGTAFAMGTPRPRAFPFPGEISAQAFRTWDGAVERFQTWVAGWPVTGRGAGVAGLVWTLPDTPFPMVPVGVVARNPMNPICGDPTALSIVIPPAIALHGHRIDLRWFVADQALTTLTDAHPIQVRL